jgi:transcriptional regulator with XRE-family HTH domain
MRKFVDIISRAEEVRKKLGLNKSQFSHRIGMKPQTYNNFVGSQGSRPNMELFYGIVREFNVDPMWLLNGSGEPFVATPRDFYALRTNESVVGRRMPARFARRSADLGALRHELDEVLAPYRTGTTPLLRSVRHSDPEVSHAAQVIKHLFWADPVDTAAQVVELLETFSQLAEEMEWLNSRSNSEPAPESSGETQGTQS